MPSVGDGCVLIRKVVVFFELFIGKKNIACFARVDEAEDNDARTSDTTPDSKYSKIDASFSTRADPSTREKTKDGRGESSSSKTNSTEICKRASHGAREITSG